MSSPFLPGRRAMARRLLLAAAGLAGVPTGAGGQAERGRTPPAPAVAELETIVASALDSVPIPGMAVGLVTGDRLAYARGFGHADLDSRAPITPRTLFQVGSISKSFTATIAARLVERGKLSFDDPVGEHIPHARLPDPRITLRQLATHTSGLPGDAPNLRRKHGDYPVLAFTHFELYRGLAESELRFPPGSGWGYSNFGYGVLGHALEMATGTPYEVLVEREIFDPLGMESSTVTLWPELADRLATPYYLDDGRLVEYTPWDEEALAPAGGIASTLEDLGRYVSFQLAEASGAGAVARLQRARVATGGGLRYGTGWFVEEMPGLGTVVSVGGDVDGYVGELVLAPRHGLGTIVLANTGDAPLLPHLGRWLLATLRASDNPAAGREARYRRGMLHQALGEWSDAARELSAAASGEEPHLAALYQLGRTGALSGRHLDEAARALEEYLRHDPLPGLSRAAARWRLGAVHERAGRCEAAARQYRQAVAEDPDLEAARAALDRLPCAGGGGASGSPR